MLYLSVIRSTLFACFLAVTMRAATVAVMTRSFIVAEGPAAFAHVVGLALVVLRTLMNVGDSPRGFFHSNL